MSSEVTVGLLADPGLPAMLAHEMERTLPSALEQRVDEDVRWHLEVKDDVLSLSPEGGTDLIGQAAALRERHDWDIVIYLTDMPHYDGSAPLVAMVAFERGAAELSLPALGALNLKRRIRETLVRLVGHLHTGTDTGQTGYATTPHRPDRFPSLTPMRGTTTEVQQAPEGADADGDETTMEVIRAPGPLHKLRLLAGMVASSRPWRLPMAMTSAAAAAAAVGAFGVFYGSIWVLSDAATVLRQVMISLLVLAMMSGWLISSNGLWERSGPRTSRRWATMDNLTTVVSVGIGTLLMYLGLFLLLLTASLVIIPPDYLSQQLGHPAWSGDYLKLSWLAASLGTMGGAIGSSFDDDESIRGATFSQREAERRQLRQDR